MKRAPTTLILAQLWASAKLQATLDFKYMTCNDFWRFTKAEYSEDRWRTIATEWRFKFEQTPRIHID